ncbi:MAG TPA: hypothetical protein VG096_20430 [Bryobacteraceae bacterium]|jgi:hypothetical protein|nr:hypothetical protein [Bryobacteraceae bacterium]
MSEITTPPADLSIESQRAWPALLERAVKKNLITLTPARRLAVLHEALRAADLGSAPGLSRAERLEFLDRYFDGMHLLGLIETRIGAAWDQAQPRRVFS